MHGTTAGARRADTRRAEDGRRAPRGGGRAGSALRPGRGRRGGDLDPRGLQPLRIEGGPPRRRARAGGVRLSLQRDREARRDGRSGRRPRRRRRRRVPPARAGAPRAVPHRLPARRARRWTAGRSSSPAARRRGSSSSRRSNDSSRLGLLGDKTVPEAAVEFIAMLEGLGNAELRGAVLRLLPEGNEERAWRNGLTTLVRGFAAASEPESPSKGGGDPQARSVAGNDEGPARAGPSVVPPARRLVTSSRPCRPCRACRRRPMPSRGPRRRSPRS